MIDIKEIKINDKVYDFTGKPFTTSDDGKCTRLNLFNSWVSSAPAGARTIDGNLEDTTATILDSEKMVNVKSIYITFEYRPMK